MNETINHSAIFKELDRITRQLDFLNFVMPERIRNLIEAVSESKTTDLCSAQTLTVRLQRSILRSNAPCDFNKRRRTNE